jgi:hypothetical protein
VGEYEQWLLNGDVDAALRLLRRIAAQAARTSTFPPPPDYDRWTDDAVDELLTEMIAKKGGVAFLIETLASVDSQGSGERYLLATVQNFLKDQAKGTAHGKLRARLDTLLGKDARFYAVSSPVRGWRLAGSPDDWWQGELITVHRTALRVRGVAIPSWNTSGQTPRSAREALTVVAVAVLTEAAGVVRAEDLAQVLLERFRHEIAPETVDRLLFDDANEHPGHANQEPEQALAGVSAEELWAGFTDEQRAIVPYLTTPDVDAAHGIGAPAGRREHVRPRVVWPGVRSQRGGDGGAPSWGELRGAPDEVELAGVAGASEEQHLRRVQGADDAADDSFGGKPGAQLLPAADAGAVGLVDALGDHAFDARGGVAEQPGAGDGGVAGGRGEDQTQRQAAAEQLLQRAAAVAVWQAAQVGVVDGEQVEHHVRRG